MSSEAINITGAESSAGAGVNDNGNGFFDVDWLTNLIVPFEFTFEQRKLKGTWYRYRTTTPDWIQQYVNDGRALIEEHRELSEKLATAKDENEIARIRMRRQEIETAGNRAKYTWVAHALVSWNAVGKDKQVLPINEEVFNQIPLPFLIAFGDYLASTRTGENPT